ncbi:MAG: hypothetical protein U1F23_08415 [Lysobacterales bacterium]
MKRLRTLLVAILLLGALSLAQAQSLQDRVAAANDTATSHTYPNNTCSELHDTGFYWEIGNVGGMYSGAAGTVPGDGVAGPGRDTPMKIASGSKWVYAAYVAQRWGAGALTARDWQFLTMSSGYHSLETDTKSACSGRSDAFTVDDCLSLIADDGTHNDYNSNDSGEFYYNGGHFEAQSGSLNLFTPITIFHGNRLGDDDDDELATELNQYLAPDANPANQWITFDWPVLAEGIDTKPGQYIDDFLRRILSHELQEYSLLGQNAVCTNTNKNAQGQPICPSALFEPPGLCASGESWHYSAGHWIEDDTSSVPVIPDDGAYSSPGARGFDPWIWRPGPPWGTNVFGWSDPMYGVVARFATADYPSTPQPQCQPARTEAETVSWASIMCGRAIRRAFLTGVTQ